MGYESKLYVVEESSFRMPSDNGKVYARVIGMIDLCKCSSIADVFEDEANGYIIADDDNTKIEEDRYGSPLGVATLDDVIEKLKEIIEITDYHRAKVALGFLETVRKEMPYCVVYHFGY